MKTQAPAPFYDLEAEQCVLGACLFSRDAVELALANLIETDFGSPNHAAMFGAIRSLHGKGAAIDALTVLDELGSQGTVWQTAGSDLASIHSNIPAISSAPRYIWIVANRSARRRLKAAAQELENNAGDMTVDPGAALDAHRARLVEIDSPVLTKPPGDIAVADFIAKDDAATVPVIAGLIAEDERAIIVGPEGYGKSEWLRQIAVCLSVGIHPMTAKPIPAMPSLIVDLENPRALLRRRLRYLASCATNNANRHERATLWHRPGGIDLRRRVDRLAFEDVLRRNRPKLVVLGPVYKSYIRKANETDEQVAAEVQSVLDDLRTRFAFAVVLEHHAPQKIAGIRELRPFGSSLWLRWPDYGLSLTPDRDCPSELLHIGRWRGDRGEGRWPDELRRGKTWPWIGWYRDGIDGDKGKVADLFGEQMHPMIDRKTEADP
jgi:replicative DNA helicase